MSAQAVLLKEMEYTDKPAPRCADCKFYSEVDGVLDRTWDSGCDLNPAFPLSISPNGRCKHFTLKPKK
jgi:hypothetical protein